MVKKSEFFYKYILLYLKKTTIFACFVLLAQILLFYGTDSLAWTNTEDWVQQQEKLRKGISEWERNQMEYHQKWLENLNTRSKEILNTNKSPEFSPDITSSTAPPDSVVSLLIRISSINPESQKKFEELIATHYTPDIYEIKLIPESPVADSPVNVEIVVYNDKVGTYDETIEVKVIYSVDGGNKWDVIELEQSDTTKVWEGEIPGQPAGTEVLYFVRAVDTSGNVTTELPCAVSEWSSSTKTINYRHEEDDDENCNILPKECLFTLSGDDAPIDDEETLIPNDLDFLYYKAGYDKEYFYLLLTVEGEISEGTASPIDAHAYMTIILNSNMGKFGNSIEWLFSQGALLFYAPLITISGNSNLANPCMINYGNLFSKNEKDITCISEGNTILFIGFQKTSTFVNEARITQRGKASTKIWN